MSEQKAVRHTVLIADPDAQTRAITIECLQPRFNILIAGSIAETLDMIKQHRPHIVLLELNQPDGDGLQLIRKLKSNPETRNLLIGCVTSRNGIDDKIAGFRAGANDYVVKPLNRRSFMWRILLLIRGPGNR